MDAASKGCARGRRHHPRRPRNDDGRGQWSLPYVSTGLGWARNVITAIAGDVILAIGGAAGTLSEIAFAWMYDRPIIALSPGGGWAARLAGECIDHRRTDKIIDCRTITELESALRAQLRSREYST
jgi:uncharacterized protein (TIGR00725 family)